MSSSECISSKPVASTNQINNMASRPILRMYDAALQLFEPFRHGQRPDQPPRGPISRAEFSNNSSRFRLPTPPQASVEPLMSRKRKAEGPAQTSRVKRQDHGHHKSSPWSNQRWAQSRLEEIHLPIQRISIQPEKRVAGDVKESRQKSIARSFLHSNNSAKKYMSQSSGYPTTVRALRTSLVTRVSKSWRSIYADPDDSDSSDSSRPQYVTSAEEHAIHMNIDENKLQAINFTTLDRSRAGGVAQDQQKEPDQTASIIGKNEDDNDSRDWDREGNLEHRRWLRNQPVSFDANGYKKPINGFVSPESQRWNEARRQKLKNKAAHDQQTPSKTPRYGSSSTPSSSDEDVAGLGDLIPVAEGKSLSNGSVNELRPTAEAHQESEERMPSFAVASANGTPAARTVKNEGHQSSEISLSSAVRGLNLNSQRTPKSKALRQIQSERKTRADTIRAEREAAKNAYPIVDLSSSWDRKVRDAVNNGHGRFEARMFNKCVPEYSNDPSARSLWLDDAVINDYIAMVAKHGSKDDRPTQVRSVAALSSYFYTKISTPSPNYSSCAGMIKRAGIQGKKLLECEKLFIPINKSYHWTLAVIEPKVPEGISPLEHPRKITIYNSMGSSGGQAVANNILNWIQNELGASYNPEEWQIIAAGRSPQQRNTDDCGVFTVTTARQIMLGKFNDKDMYKSDIITLQRKRIVAELVNGGLLNKDESQT